MPGEGDNVAPVGDDQAIPAGPENPDGMNDGNGELDPNLDAPMDDPEAGMDGGVDDAAGDDSTMSIINQLSPEDREAVRSYAESMLSREEDSPDATPEGDEAPAPAPEDGGAPMMESFIFTKGQLKKIHENLLPTEPEKEKNQVEKKHGKKLSDKSPFKSPKFN